MGEREKTREEEGLGGKHSKFRHGWQGRVGMAESATPFLAYPPGGCFLQSEDGWLKPYFCILDKQLPRDQIALHTLSMQRVHGKVEPLHLTPNTLAQLLLKKTRSRIDQR